MATAEKILEIARSQIGTRESPANSDNVKYNTVYYGRRCPENTLVRRVRPGCFWSAEPSCTTAAERRLLSHADVLPQEAGGD